MSKRMTEQQRASRKRAKYLAELKATLDDSELNEESLKALGLNDSDIDALLDRPSEIIDAEVVSVEETPNLPAAIPKVWNESGMEDQKREKRQYPPKPGRTPDGRSTNEDNVAHYNQSLESNAERRCVATNVKGERCRRYAIQGGYTCKTHGGSTRHQLNKARVRVEMASNRLMGKLIEFAFDDNKPASVQLDAIKDSLNRAGLKPPEQVEVGSIKPYEEIFADIGTGSREDSRRARGFIDAERNSPIQSEHTDSASPSDDPTEPPEQRDYDQPPAPPADEHRRRRRPQRPEPENRSWGYTEPITGYDAIRLANEANGLINPDEPGYIGDYLPPVQRALPPGRDW